MKHKGIHLFYQQFSIYMSYELYVCICVEVCYINFFTQWRIYGLLSYTY